MTNHFFLLIIPAFICCSCGTDRVENISADDYVYSQPQTRADNIDTGEVAAEGLNEELLVSMVKGILQNQFGKIDSVLIMRHDRLVLEEYFNGFDVDVIHDVKSVTKSITSLITGIAREQGYLDIDTRVYESFPEYGSFDNWTPEKEEIDVEHLLTMSAGLDCRDNDPASEGSEDKVYRFADWRKFILDLPRKYPPGKVWSYCSGGVSVLGGVLEHRIGSDLESFAERNFFSRLGVRNYRWSYSPNGQIETGGHIFITPRTMLKIGLMMLHRGNWNGQQIISEEWFERSTAPYFPYYAYLWWLTTLVYHEDDTIPDTRMIYANGFGGQRIFIVPDIDLVAVFTTSNYNNGFGGVTNYLAYKYVVPAAY